MRSHQLRHSGQTRLWMALMRMRSASISQEVGTKKRNDASQSERGQSDRGENPAENGAKESRGGEVPKEKQV